MKMKKAISEIMTHVNKPISSINDLRINFYKNKGYIGLIVENILGIKPNSSKKIDLDDGELKTFSIKRNKDGSIVPKETVAITMLNVNDVMTKEFEESQLYHKIQNILFVSILVDIKDKNNLDKTEIYNTKIFNLKGEILKSLKEDYLMIKEVLIRNNGDITKLSGRMGKYIQPRTKGSKNSTSRAFYFRKNFLSEFVLA